MLQPLTKFLRGLQAFGRGLGWLKAHPWYLLLLFIPIMLSLTAVVGGFGLFWQFQDEFFAWAMFDKPQSWWGIGLFFIVKALLYIAVICLGFVGFVLLVSIVSAPIYEMVSSAVEKSITGKTSEISLWASVKLVGEELKKVLFILFISLGILFIPFLNVLTPVVTAFCVGWDAYDYSLARRGWSFRQRWQFVLKNMPSVLGIGVWLIIPGVQMVFMPLAVVGATMLAVEDLGTFSQQATTKSKL